MFACGDGIPLDSWLRDREKKVDFAAEGANRARNEVAPPLSLGLGQGRTGGGGTVEPRMNDTRK